MNSVRWGIIGCGDVTEVKSGPALQQASGSELVAVMRRDGERARDYAQRHGVARWYDDADALIHDPGVDAVYIATPPSSHRDYTERVAAAGKPVYVEKPMARTHEECRAMIAACTAAGVPLFVAYYRRALPRYQKVRQLLGAGAIGTPRTVSVQHSRPPTDAEQRGEAGWRLRPEISGGGHFVDLASHTLDLLDYLLGPIDRVNGDAANLAGLYRAEDTVASAFSCGGQVSGGSRVAGVGLWSFATRDVEESVVVRGDGGTLRFSVFDDEAVTVANEAGLQRFDIAHPKHIQQPLIQQVVDALRGQGTCVSTGDSAARTAWVVDRLLERFRSDG